MDKAAQSPAHSLLLVPRTSFLNRQKALARGKGVLHPNRPLRRNAPPTLGFANKVAALTVNRLLTNGQLKTIFPPCGRLGSSCSIESLNHGRSVICDSTLTIEDCSRSLLRKQRIQLC